MLIVLASKRDLAARQLVSNLRARGEAAELLLCADLGRRGLRLSGDARTDTLAVGSRVLRCAELRGVVSRLVAVTPAELEHVHEADRAYAAAECHALLLAFLSGLRCPVLNRPHPGSLAGQPWSTEQWVALAARSRIAVRPVTRRASSSEAAEPRSNTPASALEGVHVVGERCFGAEDPALRRAAQRLSKASGMELLRVIFERGSARAEPRLVSADPFVDVGAPQVADAIAERCAS